MYQSPEEMRRDERWAKALWRNLRPHTISPVYDRLAQYSGHVPASAEFEFEFEYKKLRKERENVLAPVVSVFCMEEHDLLEDNRQIGA